MDAFSHNFFERHLYFFNKGDSKTFLMYRIEDGLGYKR